MNIWGTPPWLLLEQGRHRSTSQPRPAEGDVEHWHHLWDTQRFKPMADLRCWCYFFLWQKSHLPLTIWSFIPYHTPFRKTVNEARDFPPLYLKMKETPGIVIVLLCWGSTFRPSRLWHWEIRGLHHPPLLRTCSPTPPQPVSDTCLPGRFICRKAPKKAWPSSPQRRPPNDFRYVGILTVKSLGPHLELTSGTMARESWLLRKWFLWAVFCSRALYGLCLEPWL